MSMKDKDVRSHNLPVLKPEPPLLPDVSPIIISRDPQPIDIQQMITRIKLKQSPPQSTTTPLKQSAIKMEVDILREKIGQLEFERDRLVKELKDRPNHPPLFAAVTVSQQQYNQLQNDYRVLKQNYDELAKRYHQGEQTFFHLKTRCEYLQSELKKALDQPSVAATMTFNPMRLQQELTELRNEKANLLAHMTNKDSQLKSAISQLKASKDELIRLKSNEQSFVDHQSKVSTFQIHDYRKTNPHWNSQQKPRISSDIGRSNISGNSRLNIDNQRLFDDMSRLQGDYTRVNDENLRLKNQLVLIKMDLMQCQGYKAEYESISRQLQSQKQSVQLYIAECQRLKNQVQIVNQTQQLYRKDLETKLELERREVGQVIRSKLQREYSLQPGVNLKDEVNKYRQMLQSLSIEKDNTDKTLRDLNRDIILQKSKCLRLQAELKKTSQDLKELKQRQLSRRLNFTTEKKGVANRDSEVTKDTFEMIDEISKMKQQLQYHYANKNNQDALIKKLQEQNRRLKLETSILERGEDNILKKHLDLSVKEIRNLSDLAKETSNELVQKIVMLYTQKQELEKKSQCQQFELAKLYEVLQTRREQLETCYKTIQNLRRGISPPLQREQINEILRSNREHLL